MVMTARQEGTTGSGGRGDGLRGPGFPPAREGREERARGMGPAHEEGGEDGQQGYCGGGAEEVVEEG